MLELAIAKTAKPRHGPGSQSESGVRNAMSVFAVGSSAAFRSLSRESVSLTTE